jgi:hypothetical protein
MSDPMDLICPRCNRTHRECEASSPPFTLATAAPSPEPATGGPASLAGGRTGFDEMRDEMALNADTGDDRLMRCACDDCLIAAVNAGLKYMAAKRAPRAEPGAGPDAMERFLLRVTHEGGQVVRSADCSDIEIAHARACGRMLIHDALGWIHRPAALAATRAPSPEVTCSFRDPDWLAHAPTPECQIQEPHKWSECRCAAPSPQPAGAEPFAGWKVGPSFREQAGLAPGWVCDQCGERLTHYCAKCRPAPAVEEAQTAAVNSAVSVNTRPAPAPAVEAAPSLTALIDAMREAYYGADESPWVEAAKAVRALLTETRGGT